MNNEFWQICSISDLGVPARKTGNNKLIGTISELIELPAQLLAVLFIDEKEVLIPIVESMILDINLNKNKLQLAIPEGLLDVYL